MASPERRGVQIFSLNSEVALAQCTLTLSAYWASEANGRLVCTDPWMISIFNYILQPKLYSLSKIKMVSLHNNLLHEL
jgi:hypothetical protein